MVWGSVQLQNCLKAALQVCFGDHLTISSLLPPRGQRHSSPPSHHSSQSLDSCDRQNSDFLPADSKPTVRHSSVPRGHVCVWLKLCFPQRAACRVYVSVWWLDWVTGFQWRPPHLCPCPRARWQHQAEPVYTCGRSRSVTCRWDWVCLLGVCDFESATVASSPACDIWGQAKIEDPGKCQLHT